MAIAGKSSTRLILILGIVAVAVVCLVLSMCTTMCVRAMSGQDVVDRASEEAAIHGADYDQRDITPRTYYNDVSRAQSVTIMIYMCGADLESEAGACTLDLQEMLDATVGDNINLIVQTGGSERWQNSTISPRTNQIWRIYDDGLELLAEPGQKDMTDPATLADFLNFCKTNYPADRYILILWDHGGGTVGGYAYDENFPYSEAMTVQEIGTTIENSGIKFDFVGFDACLMASVEDAFVLEPAADYMIGSELPEPGYGWYYVDWLTSISRNPGIPTPQLGRIIVDSFIKNSSYPDYPMAMQLSVVDLTQLPQLFEALDDFSKAAAEQLAAGDFNVISRARQSCISRSNSDDYGMVDLAQLAILLSDHNDASDEMIAAIDNAVLYNRSIYAGEDLHGLSIAFPYTDISTYPALSYIYADIGFSKCYAGFLAGFESVMSGGQTTGTLTGDAADLTNSDWYQEWLTDEYESSGAYNTSVALESPLPLTEKDGGWVLELTPEQWDTITDIQISAFYYHEGAYLDLGTDVLWQFDEDGALKIDYSGKWVALDGAVVSFYGEGEIVNDDGTWISSGYVPALVNGEEAYIEVQWDDQHPHGYVVGYQYEYDNGVTPKGYIEFVEGDTIDYLYDFYNDNYEYEGAFTLRDTVTYSGPMTVSYEEVTGGTVLVAYQLTDTYGNQYLTETVTFN